MLKIRWTRQAEKDYLSTLEFWIKNNKSNSFSVKLMNEVLKTEKYIIKNPLSGSLFDINRKIYKLPILKHFSIIYNVDNDHINIIAFWDNRRNPENLKI